MRDGSEWGGRKRAEKNETEKNTIESHKGLEYLRLIIKVVKRREEKDKSVYQKEAIQILRAKN